MPEDDMSLEHTCGRLKMTRGVITLGDEDVVIDAGLEGFIYRDWWTHELFFNLA